MNLKCRWSEKMRFVAEADRHEIPMDAKPPFGTDQDPTPKQLLVAAICGCTGMDVVSMLKKDRQPVDSLYIDAEATPTEGPAPVVFKKVHLVFNVTGKIEARKLIDAVQLSQSKYCGVSAMVAKTVPISYSINLNNEIIGVGQADFN